jgi:hypothetical protein
VQPAPADGRHIALHDGVAAFRHRIHVFVAPDRRGAEADEPGADGVGHLAHLGQMGVHLVAGLVDGLQGRAG